MSGVILEEETGLPTLKKKPVMLPGQAPRMQIQSDPREVFSQWRLVEHGGPRGVDACEVLVRTAISLCAMMAQETGRVDVDLMARATIIRFPTPAVCFDTLTEAVVADKQRFRDWARENCKCGLAGQPVTPAHFPSLDVRPGDKVHPRLGRWVSRPCQAREHVNREGQTIEGPVSDEEGE